MLLLVGPGQKDPDSLFTPAQARRYLEKLRVPLLVWYIGRPKHAPADWGAPVAIPSYVALEREVEALRGRLDRQRIVWVDGSHLVHSVALSSTTSGLRLLD